jgi:chromosome segregation ATPase
VLTTHKVEVLADTRTKIKVLEKEIERMQVEKDGLEEQRDSTEEEIEKMEGQVRDIEDQIRDHNRSSSMLNGRVNVAHARKKRRLDAELERILETIEVKRAYMAELDERAADKGSYSLISLLTHSLAYLLTHSYSLLLTHTLRSPT